MKFIQKILPQKNFEVVFAILFFTIFLFNVQHASAADPYKPYLHEPQIPEHPKLKLYGSYATNLFPGAATYTYSIETPSGTNGLQPSVALSYNSQSAKQSGLLGSGWSITQNYVYRDVNSTPSNVSDDEFKLIFNDASYDLVYDSSDGLYHTKMESFLKVQNLTGAPNNNSVYWVVTTKDGMRYRFGYNNDSELESTVARNYSLRWYLDEVKDTHDNKIIYSYLENSNPEDRNVTYPSQIVYNNDQQRQVDFSYEATGARRLVIEQGHYVNQSRRLSEIVVWANGLAVRNYRFEYANLSAEQSSFSLAKIKYFGSDGTSLLHQVSFAYHYPEIGYRNRTTVWIAPVEFSDTIEDDGVRLVDLNRDGYVDMIQGRDFSGGNIAKKAWLNNGANNWTDASSVWAPPIEFLGPLQEDYGFRLVDFNGDGFVDILRADATYPSERKAWMNNGNGWIDVSSIWKPPIDFVRSSTGIPDFGVLFTDFNGDGRVDILMSRENTFESPKNKSAWLNTGKGWTDATATWLPPTYFMDGNTDKGVRVEDVNGDGLPDIIESYREWGGGQTKRAWLNNGNGWENSSVWNDIPMNFVDNGDTGLRLLEINGDGLVDLVVGMENSTNTEKHVWINNGTGWLQNDSWNVNEILLSHGQNKGRRLADVNGDGFADLVVAYKNETTTQFWTWEKNITTPFLLKKITTEYGGTITIDSVSVQYNKSTQFNNTGNDSLSDLGFNIWVVRNVLQNNSMPGRFAVIANYTYNYSGGSYDYDNSEFRGFALTNETLPDKSLIVHYFHQDDARKGKEYKTEIYNSSRSLFSRAENFFNYTNISVGGNLYHKTFLLSQTNYFYDGSPIAPNITNVSYVYDSYGNVLHRNFFGDVNISGDEKYERYAYALNTSGWIVDRLSWYLLFASDNSTKVIETKYSYDNLPYSAAPIRGDLTEIDNWLDTGGNQKTKFAYDSLGNVIRETNPLGAETTYTYGLRDTTFTYPDRITNALFHTADYAYDIGTGNLIWQKQNEITNYFYYDIFGRIIKEVQPFDSYELPTKNYTYFFDGNTPEYIKISQRTSANKTSDTYFYYDGFGNFIQLKRPADNNRQIVKNFYYDGLGRVISESNPYFDTFSVSLSTPSSTVNATNYTYDTLGRVNFVLNPDSSNKTINFDHRTITAYDENGHRKAYVLDTYDRIKNVLEYNNDPVLGWNFESDIYNTSYEYDTSDNLVKITDSLGNIFSFTYDSLGRRTALIDPDLGNWTYTYNLAGNLIRQQQQGGGNLVTGDGFYREYDALNQLIIIRNGSTVSSPIIENYTYDPFGIRIKIERNDSASTKIYTPFKELMRIVNSSGTFDFTYIYQDGTLVARVNPDGSKYYYHPDHLGSTSLITNQNGNVVENTFYSPFGELLGGGSAENKLYTGQFKDSSCQFYYGARYYNPCIGRWHQPDVNVPNIYNSQSLNRFSYSLNNPIKYIDPTGRDAKLVIDDENKEIVVSTTIYIYGDAANADLAKQMEEDINFVWNQGFTYQSGGQTYNVRFDVKVAYVSSKPDYIPLYENAVEIFSISKRDKSIVPFGNLPLDNNYGRTGEWTTDREQYVHEVGHFFGLDDRLDAENIMNPGKFYHAKQENTNAIIDPYFKDEPKDTWTSFVGAVRWWFRPLDPFIDTWLTGKETHLIEPRTQSDLN